MRATWMFGVAAGILNLVPISAAKADAVNDTRVLRKAAGECKGSLKLTITETPYWLNAPLGSNTTTSTRKGDVIIPGREGRARSLVDHLSQPGATMDSTAEGVVRDARVLRGGKLIRYAGKCDAEPVLDDDGEFAVNGNATSTIRGAKVVTTSSGRGSRTLKDPISGNTTEVTTVTGQGRGTSLF